MLIEHEYLISFEVGILRKQKDRRRVGFQVLGLPQILLLSLEKVLGVFLLLYSEIVVLFLLQGKMLRNLPLGKYYVLADI